MMYIIVGRVFANGLRDQSSIPSRVLPKTQKMIFGLALSIIRYVSRLKWCNPGKGAALSLTPQCSSYWQGILRVALNYGCQLNLYIYIYIDKPDMQDTAGEARTNSSVMYSYGPPHMAKQKQDDQLEHTYRCYVRIRDVALKTCQKWWMIGRSGERGSGISVLVARHDDDIYIYIFGIK